MMTVYQTQGEGVEGPRQEIGSFFSSTPVDTVHVKLQILTTEKTGHTENEKHKQKGRELLTRRKIRRSMEKER